MKFFRSSDEASSKASCPIENPLRTSSSIIIKLLQRDSGQPGVLGQSATPTHFWHFRPPSHSDMEYSYHTCVKYEQHWRWLLLFETLRVRKISQNARGSDPFEGGCFGRGSLPHARLRHSRQLVQHLVLHKCCLEITFRDFSPPSVIEIPRYFFADARNCIPRVCVKISSQKKQERVRYFEKKLIFGAHCQSW